ncbi:MAG: hypothetical protein ABJE95_22275 [Byssovorax sp.]
MRKNSGTRVAALLVLALAGGLGMTTGCGPITSLCQQICACVSCSSDGLDACEVGGTRAAEQADAAGCSRQYNAAVACVAAHASCEGDPTAAPECAAELLLLSTCPKSLGVLGDGACDVAADQIKTKLDSCPSPPKVTGDDGGPPPACTADAGKLLICQAAAFARGACDCIGGGDVTLCTAGLAKSFTDAFTACN